MKFFIYVCILLFSALSVHGFDESVDAQQILSLLPDANYNIITFFNYIKLHANETWAIEKSLGVIGPGHFGVDFSQFNFTFYIGTEKVKIKIDKELLKKQDEILKTRDRSNHEPLTGGSPFKYVGGKLSIYGCSNPEPVFQWGVKNNLLFLIDEKFSTLSIYTYDLLFRGQRTKCFVASSEGGDIFLADSIELLTISLFTARGELPSALTREDFKEIIDIWDELGERWTIFDQRSSHEIQKMAQKEENENDSLKKRRELIWNMQPQMTVYSDHYSSEPYHKRMILFKKEAFEGDSPLSWNPAWAFKNMSLGSKEGKVRTDIKDNWIITIIPKDESHFEQIRSFIQKSKKRATELEKNHEK